MDKILITGGCGFIGHHFVEHLLKNTTQEIVIFDKLTYASEGFTRLRDIDAYDDKRVMIVALDFTKEIPIGVTKEIGTVDYIMHMGAETHVDNSITDPAPFVFSNVIGTMRMLDYARTLKGLKKFVYFSTDEVFGPAPEGAAYKEWDRYNSTNPYAASKAGVIGFTKSIAKELGSRNIRCNAVAPGFVETDMTSYLKEGEAADKYKAGIPLGRFGTTEDIANVSLFLASDLSRYVTGQVISACGGLNI